MNSAGMWVADLALLIDTNVLIWLYKGDNRVSKHAAAKINAGDEQIYISVLSAWEYGQKRLKHPESLKPKFDDVVAGLPHIKLDLEYAIHRYAVTLPLIHRDPFDRMLIAQAIHHDLTIVASDDKIRQYPCKSLW
jgi:PIN domain nuclease of toxin-antitoxin system